MNSDTQKSDYNNTISLNDIKKNEVNNEVIVELKSIEKPTTQIYNKKYWEKNLSWTHQNL